jgi:hypothetical protein
MQTEGLTETAPNNLEREFSLSLSGFYVGQSSVTVDISAANLDILHPVTKTGTEKIKTYDCPLTACVCRFPEMQQKIMM